MIKILIIIILLIILFSLLFYLIRQKSLYGSKIPKEYKKYSDPIDRPAYMKCETLGPLVNMNDFIGNNEQFNENGEEINNPNNNNNILIRSGHDSYAKAIFWRIIRDYIKDKENNIENYELCIEQNTDILNNSNLISKKIERKNIKLQFNQYDVYIGFEANENFLNHIPKCILSNVRNCRELIYEKPNDKNPEKIEYTKPKFYIAFNISSVIGSKYFIIDKNDEICIKGGSPLRPSPEPEPINESNLSGKKVKKDELDFIQYITLPFNSKKDGKNITYKLGNTAETNKVDYVFQDVYVKLYREFEKLLNNMKELKESGLYIGYIEFLLGNNQKEKVWYEKNKIYYSIKRLKHLFI